MMRQLYLMTALLLTGCNLQGPFAPRSPQRVDDPHLPIYQQEARGRDRLALPEQSADVAPRTQVEFPGPHGR